ncbi:glucuronate isomerase [Holdemanella sp.]|nr:glucuronate isomerase [Holdemanella sp.]
MKSIKKVLGCFQNSDAIGKIQQGSAWWFNDNKIGMEKTNDVFGKSRIIR